MAFSQGDGGSGPYSAENSKKTASAIVPAALKLKSLQRSSGPPYVNRTALSPPFHQSKSTAG